MRIKEAKEMAIYFNIRRGINAGAKAVRKVANVVAFQGGKLACRTSATRAIYNLGAEVAGLIGKRLIPGYELGNTRSKMVANTGAVQTETLAFAIANTKPLSELSVIECYERIYVWHKQYGSTKLLKARPGNEKNIYDDRYRELLKALPSPLSAKSEDVDLVIKEVLTGHMEWSFHQIDAQGNKMFQYAERAARLKYNKHPMCEELASSMQRSSLYKIVHPA
jgi:hypothetical protein